MLGLFISFVLLLTNQKCAEVIYIIDRNKNFAMDPISTYVLLPKSYINQIVIKQIAIILSSVSFEFLPYTCL